MKATTAAAAAQQQRRCRNTRLRKLAAHVCAADSSGGANAAVRPTAVAAGGDVLVNTDTRLTADMNDPQYEWTKQMRGRIWEHHDGDLVAAEAELAESGQVFKGQLHEELQRMAEEYGHENFSIPRTNNGWGAGPVLEPWLVINDPADAQQISRLHTKKAGMYQPTFLVSTRADPPQLDFQTGCLTDCFVLLGRGHLRAERRRRVEGSASPDRGGRAAPVVAQAAVRHRAGLRRRVHHQAARDGCGR